MSNEAKKNTKEGLQYELDTIEGTNKVKVIKDGKDSYVITFLDTNRNYKVQYGKEVEGPIAIDITEDAQAGDITKGNTLDGSKEKPYQINCIEDLVDFSNRSKKDGFTGKEIIVTRNLDFLSELSYENYQTTKYGDINKDGKTSELMEELSTGIGFNPISAFEGIFDGKNNKISNLYINSNTLNTGLFYKITNATVKNLILHGEIFSSNAISWGTNIGGITGCAFGKCYFYNLEYNGRIGKGEPSSKNAAGGIVGLISRSSSIIEINQCRNNSNIADSAYIGGIVGKSEGNIKIINCYNTGVLRLKIRGKPIEGDYLTIGGIISCPGGSAVSGDTNTIFNIENCFNTGTIINEVKSIYNASGGILGSSISHNNVNITNCYNIGETSSKYTFITPFSGGIQGGFWYNQYKSNISNCYYDGAKSDRSVGGATKEYATKLTTSQMQGKEKIENQDGTSSTLVELLNKEIDNNSTGTDTSNWLRWKEGENGYPTFDGM